MPILEPCLVDLMQLVRESYILLIAVNRDITLLLVWTKKKKLAEKGVLQKRE